MEDVEKRLLVTRQFQTNENIELKPS